MLHTEGPCKASVHVSVPFPQKEKNGRRGGQHAKRAQLSASRQRRAERKGTSTHIPRTAPDTKNTCWGHPRLPCALAVRAAPPWRARSGTGGGEKSGG